MMMTMNTMLIRDLVAATLLFFITGFFIRSLTYKLHRLGHKYPPGPTGWPLVGALPLLGSLPHVTLAKMAKKYGPIMYLKMGNSAMVVASTPDAARLFLYTLGSNFVDRPVNAAVKHVTYNVQGLVFAAHSPRWKLLRKLINLHMFGGKAIESWSDIRRNEIGYMLQDVCDSSKSGEPMVIERVLSHAVANMIGEVTISKRVFSTRGSESNEFRDMVVELSTLIGLFNISDFIPYIRWMDLQGIERRARRLHKRLDAIISRFIVEHEKSTHLRKGKPDFLDVTMAASENSDGEKLTLTNFKALVLDLFIAGIDTSTITTEWALTEMLNNPKILKRAQDEMDQVIGKDRRLEESDLANLPYFKAVCKENLRKHPPTALNVPRISSEPCNVNGYYIPKGTPLSVNIWAIGRDPNVWENPLEFNPERFISGKHAKTDPHLGNDFDLIPFGAGRRMCAGARIGSIFVEYILGTLIHSFNWELPKGVTELNMDERFGLALHKKVPLVAIVIPRLHTSVYST